MKPLTSGPSDRKAAAPIRGSFSLRRSATLPGLVAGRGIGPPPNGNHSSERQAPILGLFFGALPGLAAGRGMSWHQPRQMRNHSSEREPLPSLGTCPNTICLSWALHFRLTPVLTNTMLGCCLGDSRAPQEDTPLHKPTPAEQPAVTRLQWMLVSNVAFLLFICDMNYGQVAPSQNSTPTGPPGSPSGAPPGREGCR
jgi:hypothetical protein